jgi:hypothetical protein
LGPLTAGGVHVVYDTDGSIFTELFGVPGVLGLTVISMWPTELGHPEVTVILNGFSVPEPNEPGRRGRDVRRNLDSRVWHAINWRTRR